MKNAMLFMGLQILSFGSSSQSLKELEARNGFKSYKLGSVYNSSIGEKEKTYNDQGYCVNIKNTFDYIGEIPVSSIELLYLKDTLSQISIVVDDKYSIELLQALRMAFGNYTNSETAEESENFNRRMTGSYIPSLYDTYTWHSKKIRMTLYVSERKLQSRPITYSPVRLVYSIGDIYERQKRSDFKYKAENF